MPIEKLDLTNVTNIFLERIKGNVLKRYGAPGFALVRQAMQEYTTFLAREDVTLFAPVYENKDSNKSLVGDDEMRAEDAPQTRIPKIPMDAIEEVQSLNRGLDRANEQAQEIELNDETSESFDDIDDMVDATPADAEETDEEAGEEEDGDDETDEREEEEREPSSPPKATKGKFTNRFKPYSKKARE